ncbi:MAG: gliding motility-associated C-terminal domain-containing protein [Flavobacteriales bacterium]|jgi:gliding motility-associated-like protein|nr:gliding motility-associated C-terminal domain-containing protein [Flavobacteriales bacterium]
MRKLFTILLGLIFTQFSLAQMAVSNQAPFNSMNYLVNNQLMNTNISVTASNVTLSAGSLGQIGAFQAFNTNLNMDEGVILSTGGISKAYPNSNTGFGYNSNTDLDLQKLVITHGNGNAASFRNSVVLEFDFVAISNEMEFEYIFASYEYKEYVCSEYNDVFGFFISGPGITGPYSNNAQNIALVPNASNPNTFKNVPVMINTINHGSPGGSGSNSNCLSIDPAYVQNSVFYVDNPQSTPVGFTGFTKPLKAKATLECGKTYHIKLAIADISDENFNSAVFLKKGSFGFENPLTMALKNKDIVVKCNNQVTIDPGVSGGNGTYSYQWFFNGTLISTAPTISISDVGDYKIIVEDECIAIDHEFKVIEYTEMNLNLTDDIVICNDTIITPVITGGAPPFSFTWFKDGTYLHSNSQLNIQQGISGKYRLEILDDCGYKLFDTVDIFSPEKLEVEFPDDTYLCEDLNDIIAKVSGGHGNVVYFWVWDGDTINDTKITVKKSFHGEVEFTAYDDCGTYLSKKIFLYSPDKFEKLSLSIPKYEFEMCRRDREPMPIEIFGGVGGYEVSWYINNVFVSNAEQYIFDAKSLKLGANTIRILITDKCDNKVDVSLTINVSDCWIPNIFTPNNDGINDYFYFPFGDFQENMSVEIYNRWGQEIYKSDNYDRCLDDENPECWDGKVQKTGAAITEGVYYYIITFEDNTEVKGNVVVKY